MHKCRTPGTELRIGQCDLAKVFRVLHFAKGLGGTIHQTGIVDQSHIAVGVGDQPVARISDAFPDQGGEILSFMRHEVIPQLI